MADGFTLELHGLQGVYDALLKLPPEIVSKRGGPVKAALRKGATVILKQEKANLAAVMGHQVDGEMRLATGLLLKNLVVTRGKPPIGTKGERYLVRVKRKTYPRKKGKAVTTVNTALNLEYGNSKQKAEPFIRPAALSKATQAIRTIETDLSRRVEQIAAKLLQANKGK
jgi:hypothetical protein